MHEEGLWSVARFFERMLASKRDIFSSEAGEMKM